MKLNEIYLDGLSNNELLEAVKKLALKIIDKHPNPRVSMIFVELTTPSGKVIGFDVRWEDTTADLSKMYDGDDKELNSKLRKRVQRGIEKDVLSTRHMILDVFNKLYEERKKLGISAISYRLKPEDHPRERHVRKLDKPFTLEEIPEHNLLVMLLKDDK